MFMEKPKIHFEMPFRYCVTLAFFLLSGILAYADLTVGNESFSPKRDGTSKYFQQCNANASYSETTGYTLRFAGSSVISGKISAFGDLHVILSASADVLVSVSSGLALNATSSLKISGPGTLSVRGGYVHGGSIDIVGAVLFIDTGATKNSALSSDGSIPC